MNELIKEKLKTLNKEQLEAVLHNENPCLVIAGAGSGKTTVLTLRIARLIEEGVDPTNILVVTFTKDATNNMKKRLNTLIGKEKTDKLVIGTFHSICLRLLKENGYIKENAKIIPEWQQEKIINDIVSESFFDNYDIPSILRWISLQQGNLLPWNSNPNDFNTDELCYSIDKLIEIYREYELHKKKNNLIDYGDMIIKCHEMLETKELIRVGLAMKFEYICVDEAQDSTQALLKIIRILAEEHNNVFMVGDLRQSIYGFANAKVENLLNFEEVWDNSKVIYLTHNYRSSQGIVDLSNKLTNNNNHKYMVGNSIANKKCEDDVQLMFCEDDYCEATYVAEQIKKLVQEGYSYKDIAVIFRVNTQSPVIETIFRKADIPYIVVGNNEFFGKKEIQACISYLQLAQNPNNDMAFSQIYNYPNRLLGRDFLDRLKAYSLKHGISLYQSIKKAPFLNGDLNWRKKAYELYHIIEKLNKFYKVYKYDTCRVLEEVIHHSGIYKFIQGKVKDEDNGGVDNLECLIEMGSKFKSANTFLKFANKSLVEANSSKSRGDKVKLITCHKSKGLEYKITFCVGFSQGIIPYKKAMETFEGYNEERRVAYVGITRAEEKLFITSPKKKGKTYLSTSDFLLETHDLEEIKNMKKVTYAKNLNIDDEEDEKESFETKDNGYMFDIDYLYI